MVTWWDEEGDLQKRLEAPNLVLRVNDDAVHWESVIQEKQQYLVGVKGHLSVFFYYFGS